MKDELFDPVPINSDGTRFTRPAMVDGLDRIWTHNPVGDSWSSTEHDGEPLDPEGRWALETAEPRPAPPRQSDGRRGMRQL